MECDDFSWLQRWYQKQCNGDWEHQNGILLQTVDNPGWSLTINVEETELDGKEFKKIKSMRSDDNWIICSVESGKFEGWGGVGNLSEILKIFRVWAEDC